MYNIKIINLIIAYAICNLPLYVESNQAIFFEDVQDPAAIYSQIIDIKHPTNDDYRMIQNEFKSKQSFKLIGDSAKELPQRDLIYVNSSKEDKENCIITYATFNRNYVAALEKLVENIKKSDYKGHVLYYKGGWPDLESGSLVLSYVPYAFKVCCFKEAQRLGYKRVLWIDTSLTPVVSLNTLFNDIKEKGHLIIGNTHMVAPYFTEKAANAFGLTLEQTADIPSCASFLFGVDLTNEKSVKVIDAWFEAAKNKGYYNSRPDQSSLSVILYQAGIKDLIDISRFTYNGYPTNPDTLFVINRGFSHSNPD